MADGFAPKRYRRRCYNSIHLPFRSIGRYTCHMNNVVDIQAKAVAYESSATFFCISAASLTSKYVSIHPTSIELLTYVIIPFKAYCCHIGTAIKHPVPDRVKPSFVIFDIRALWRSLCPTDRYRCLFFLVVDRRLGYQTCSHQPF